MSTPILDAVQAILADDTISFAEKRRLVRIARARGMRDAISAAGPLPLDWSFVRNTVTWGVTLTELQWNQGDVFLWLTVTRNGKAIAINNPVIVRNPPCQTATVASGVVVPTYDPVTAIRQVVASSLRGG